MESTDAQANPSTEAPSLQRQNATVGKIVTSEADAEREEKERKRKEALKEKMEYIRACKKVKELEVKAAQEKAMSAVYTPQTVYQPQYMQPTVPIYGQGDYTPAYHTTQVAPPAKREPVEGSSIKNFLMGLLSFTAVGASAGYSLYHLYSTAKNSIEKGIAENETPEKIREQVDDLKKDGSNVPEQTKHEIETKPKITPPSEKFSLFLKP